MTEDLSARIVAFVKPFMEDHSSRQSYLDDVLRDSPALDHIKYGIGGAQPFTGALVKTVRTWGRADDLCRLVSGLARLAGDEHQREAEQLCQQIRAQKPPQKTAATLKPGDVVCGCTLVKELGKGGNGEVWLASQPLSDTRPRDVAIKVLRPDRAGDPERVRRFREEPGVQARLEWHQHITNVYTVCEHNGLPAIVMQFVDGGSLDKYISGRAFDLETACGWLGQIASALDAAHALEPDPLYHRDVKPENILFRQEADGVPRHLYLTDFGLALSDSPEKVRDTMQGEKVGTREYIAPEQFASDFYHYGITPMTDVYALGIMAYELLTGGVPFTGDPDEILAAHRTQKLRAHERLTDDVLRVLRIATAKIPALRPASAGEFVAMLHVAGQGKTPPDRVEQYIVEWAERAGEHVDDEFDIPDLLSGDIEQLIPERPTEPAQAVPRRRERLEKLRQRRRGNVDPAGDYRQNDQQQPRLVENVRQQLLDFKHGVLLGQPGSGKSWTLRRLMFDFVARWREAPETTRIPVFVPLNEYRGDVPFVDFVRSQMGSLAAYYDALRQSERLTLLCDALNEMPNQQITLDRVKTYLREVREEDHFVVSCRVLDYQRQLDDLLPLEQVTLRELDLPAIHRFVLTYWDEHGPALWQAMGGSDELFEAWKRMKPERFWDGKAAARERWPDRFERAWKQMHSGAGLIPLCRSPFMAGLVCELYDPDRPEAPLPGSRGEIFAGFVADSLAEEAERAHERGDKFPAVPEIEATLAELANAMQERKVTVLSRSGDDAPPIMAQSGLIDAGIAASILTGDVHQVKFAHQLFQEYFAAPVLLAAMENGEDPAKTITGRWWEPGVWRETAVILGELAGPNEVVTWLAPYSPLLAQIVISENAEFQAGQVKLSAAARQALAEGAQQRTSEAHPVGRAAAYRVLGHPDIDADDRAGIGVDADGLPDIAWSKPIPPGEYPIGGDEKAYEPLPAGTHKLTYSYQLSKYPVTYAQFGAFLSSSDGYKSEEHDWFAGLAANADDRKMGEQEFRYANHPRETVNWYQALAYCRWLSWRLTGRFYELEQIGEWPVRLPTEYEWEIAARGTDGREYPYEGKFDAAKGNTYETGIRQTSAVGIFPAGASPYGVLDMSGNVWEWCLNPYDNPDGGLKSKNVRSDARRVLRGGSWYFTLDFARAVFRDYYGPDYRDFIGGFRLLCRPHFLNR